MNIWIVNHYAIPPSMGGLVRHYYFSKYLQKMGHNVKIFTSSKIHNTDINMIKDNALYREKMEDGVEYTFVRSKDYKGNGLDRIFNMIDLPFKMWKTMKVFWKIQKPDVIYTSSPDLFVAFFALLFGKRYEIPVVVEIRDLWPESIVEYNGISKNNPIIQILYQLEKWIYTKADQLIFTMAGGKKYICDKKWENKVDLNKINHVNNGVDLQEFEENLKKHQIEDNDLKSDKFKIIYVGSIRKVNNLKALVDASKYIDKEKVVILIYGNGTEREELEHICKEEKLCIKFKGHIEKKYVPYVLSKANLNLINVSTAGLNQYGCSWNKLFEYMASGKPILCNTPTAYDLIIEKNVGVSKKFDDARAYGECIKEFIELGQQQYDNYCQNAKKCVEQYDYKNLTLKIEEILMKAINMKMK
ncbi:glycosyltransferase family 4 protein [Faecalicatena contorta]|uniref:glycosyltransferase family 4 protein n=1 Tax=Faecalicatena contorta TaxID=39482 RepID=UPI001F36A535|nr:glycosyltransferase family 4 protein [Faecalicatena contorta]MCF2681351.1 glycosyltransferase family 4 protein [Faecalicatena contorta]